MTDGVFILVQNNFALKCLSPFFYIVVNISYSISLATNQMTEILKLNLDEPAITLIETIYNEIKGIIKF
jgi:hypothetical protein